MTYPKDIKISAPEQWTGRNGSRDGVQWAVSQAHSPTRCTPFGLRPVVHRFALLNVPDFLNQIVTRFLQQFLEAEITSFLQAEPYQRTTDRTGYRNGYKPRILKTRVGRIDLSLPQDREGQWTTILALCCACAVVHRATVGYLRAFNGQKKPCPSTYPQVALSMPIKLIAISKPCIWNHCDKSWFYGWYSRHIELKIMCLFWF